ncbi:MAG: DMT family transporter [Agathobacter sp.]|nr:DMT family transporter [Agathobacter sp.]
MTPSKKGYLFIVLSAICFATGGILIKINSWSPMTISGVRSLFAIPVLYIFYRKIGHKFHFNRSVFFCALANTGMCTTFVIANKLTTAANAIVLQFTLPIYILLLTWIFFKKKPDKISVISALLSFAGICFFFFDSISTTGMIGNIVALVSGFLYAIVFMTKKIPGSDFASSALLSFALNFVIGIPFMLQETTISQTNIISVVLLGVIQIGFAYIFLEQGLTVVSPIGAALASMIEPILNPILVAIFYGETISAMSFAGAVIVFISSIIYNVYESMRKTD